MTHAPKLSVIVPCFNYGHLLAESLDSVRSQSLEDWECIVIDDGSTDNTGAVADSYASKDSRYSRIRQQNLGLSAARNAGLRVARGEYVQLLDADDLLEREKFKEQAGFLDEHTEYGLVYGPMRYFRALGASKVFARGRNGVDVEWMRMWPDTNDAMLAAIVEGNQFPVSAALFRRTLLAEVGYFDESLRSHEDWEFWLRWAFAGKRFAGLDEPGTKTLIREHGESLTRRSVTMIETRLLVRERIEGLVATQALRARNRECATYDRCELGAAQLAAGHWIAGIRQYLASFAGAKRKARAIQLLLAHAAPRWLLSVWWGLRRRATTGHLD
jgi:glycosyltransferase involved in cell wall biosynthesis